MKKKEVGGVVLYDKDYADVRYISKTEGIVWGIGLVVLVLVVLLIAQVNGWNWN